MTQRHLGLDDCRALAAAYVKPYHSEYLSMYSSILGGVVTLPFLMTVPVDDHMVHRGDGIFETFKCVGGHLYNFDRHLERLERSARSLHLKLPADRAGITGIVRDTIRIGAVRDCAVRIFVSRGPGGFTVNPYECPASQLYVVVSHLHLPTEQDYARGVTAKSSIVPAKSPYYAGVKSCNYLPNVLMKKEAVDAGVDYTIALNDDGFLAEGAAENVAILTRDKILKLPRFASILKGTTVSRAIEMLEMDETHGGVKAMVFEDIALGEAYDSEEFLIFGTTFNIFAAVVFDGQSIGGGKPGPLFQVLQERFEHDIRHNRSLQTPVFEA